MQVIPAKIHLIFVCLLWLAGCSTGAETAVPPTPILSVRTSVAATPTLVPSPTPLPTPTPDPRSIGDPYAPELGNLGYDVQHYTLRLALDPAVVAVQGTAVIDAVTSAPLNGDLSLDFVGFDVSGAWWGETAVAVSRTDTKLLVTPPQPLPAGTPFRLTISYQGEPVQRTSPYVRYADHLGLVFKEDNIYALGEPDGARYWFPGNDHPRDKALFRFEVTVPPPYTAVANGRLLSTTATPDGRQTFTWEHNYPMATYLALVAVGEYERIDDFSPGGVPLRHYIFPDEQENFAPVAAMTGAAVDWMSEQFGPYPFETFGFVMVRDLPLAMEAQTVAIMSPELTGRKTAAHELSHMWFGNWVSLNSWSEMWRNEGFATYIEMLWRYRDDPAGFEALMVNIAAEAKGSGWPYALGEPPPAYLFDYNVYLRGAALVHALRLEMGEEAFWAGLRTYLQQYGGGTASHVQFQAVMEAAAGKSLTPFFAEWLE